VGSFPSHYSVVSDILPGWFYNNLDLRIYMLAGSIGLPLYLICSKNRKPTLLVLLAMISLWLSSIIAGLRVYQGIYFIYFTPLLSILIGAMLHDTSAWLNRLVKGAGVIFIGVILIANLYDFVDTGLWSQQIKKDYDNALNLLDRAIPAGTRVMGVPNYYPALYKDRSYFAPLYVQNSCPDFGSSLAGLKVDYFIYDEIIENLFSMWCSRDYAVSTEEFLNKNAELSMAIHLQQGYPNFNAAHGYYLRNILVYRILD